MMKLEVKRARQIGIAYQKLKGAKRQTPNFEVLNCEYTV